MGGWGIVFGELLFLAHGRKSGFSEANQEGCLTILGIIPMLVGGYLFGCAFSLLALLALAFGLKSRSKLAIGLGALGLLASLAGVGATLLMQLDAADW
jgi:hypothetical protein